MRATLLIPLLLGCAGAPSPGAEDKPNIVYIPADDLG